jgi:hypothetical protein
MPRFLEYEAYAAHNDVLGECSTSLKMSSAWVETEKGVEALSTLTVPFKNRDCDNRKALTFSDLIVKVRSMLLSFKVHLANLTQPMQRILKYPLFFGDLCRQTPVCDDPVAHAELEKVLYRLQETAKRINQATNNVELRKRIQITWLLEDRFEFNIQVR